MPHLCRICPTIGPMRITLLVLATLLLRAQAQAPRRTFRRRACAMLDPLAKMVNDYGNTARYAAEDARCRHRLRARSRGVPGRFHHRFWGRGADPSGHSLGVFFPGKPYINRASAARSRRKMLLRFYQT